MGLPRLPLLAAVHFVLLHAGLAAGDLGGQLIAGGAASGRRLLSSQYKPGDKVRPWCPGARCARFLFVFSRFPTPEPPLWHPPPQPNLYANKVGPFHNPR